MAWRENYTLHKLHSLTGIVPVGFYLVQHLTLNSFALAGPKYFNGVVGFFEGLPFHVLAVLKYGIVWLPLIFHAVYGFFIVQRGELNNYVGKNQKYRENRYYQMQRITGIIAAIFLILHMTQTSVAGAIYGAEEINYYHNWEERLVGNYFMGIPYAGLLFYVIGVTASAYHFAYGLWNFCIRWGITINEKAQLAMSKAAFAIFLVITGVGLSALAGFFMHEDPEHGHGQATVSRPLEGPQDF